jgi:Sec-independent protein translocase protein TatA
LEKWKPTIADLTMIRDGLVSAVGKFKAALKALRDEEQRQAAIAAAKARREAEEAARKASKTDLEAQREAAEKLRAADEAAKAVKAVDVPKGMRTVHKYRIADHRAALNWIAVNDRDAMTAFIEDYVAKKHKATTIDGVEAWTEKEAF